MKNLFTNKYTIIAVLFFVSLVTFSIVYASAVYNSFIVTYSGTQSHEAPDLFYVEPGSSFNVTGTLDWSAGFTGTLPAMGLGAPGLGYLPASYPMTCSASGGVGPGNSNGTSICERTFNSSVAGTGSASFTINVSADAPRGSTYSLGLTSNGGSNPQEKDFTLRINPTPPPVCSVNTLTCTSETLSWSTTNCSSISIKGPNPTYPVVPVYSLSGSVSPVAGGSYLLYGPDGAIKSGTTCPTIPAKLTVSGDEKATGTPGQPLTIPFNFSNTGGVGSSVHVDGSTGCTATTSGGISIVFPFVVCDTGNYTR